jgi:DNA-binding transcriptional ArsR family regulator
MSSGYAGRSVALCNLQVTIRREAAVTVDAPLVLDALGNAIRREILELLATGPQPVGDIAARFPISRPAISKHLRILEQAQLVSHSPSGTRHLFRLEGSGFDAARSWLDRFWPEALQRYAALAEQTWRADG